jgi:hypothetical protein
MPGLPRFDLLLHLRQEVLLAFALNSKPLDNNKLLFEQARGKFEDGNALRCRSA